MRTPRPHRFAAIVALAGLAAFGGCTCRGEAGSEPTPIRPDPPLPEKKKEKAKDAAPEEAPSYPTPSDGPFDNVAPDDGKFPFALVPRDPPPPQKPAPPATPYLVPKGWDPATYVKGPDEDPPKTTKTAVGIDIVSYRFVGASDAQYGLELKRDGARVMLLRDVYMWSLNLSRDRLLVDTAIVDLKSLARTELPRIPCAAEAYWAGDRVATHSFPKDMATANPTQLCIFNGTGVLLGRLVGHDLPWRAFSNYSLELTFGFLRRDPEIFYAIDSQGPTLVYLLDLRDPTKRWTYRISAEGLWRSMFDLDGFTFAKPIVRTREDPSEDAPTPPWTTLEAELVAP